MEVSRRSRAVIRFGLFEVDLRAGELRRSGLKIRLQQQPFRVLALLLEHSGEVVTREELRQAIWPGDEFVDFDEGLNAAIYRLRNVLGDSSENPRFLETLPRRGYRFIASVEEIAPRATRVPNRLRLLAGGVLAAEVLALLFGLNLGGLRDRLFRRSTEKRIRSLAVLPLENLSGDPSQEYFVDSMTEALTTDLGKIGTLRVISRTSAMHYKGTHKALPEIARELNVDAVLEGGVWKSGDQVRITAQLIEAATDRHLWAETYHKDLRDVLALQDEVARSIAGQVQIRLLTQEQIRLASARPVNPEAYEAYLRGRYEENTWTEESLTRSVEYFEEALRKDPGYAPAWAGLSDAYRLLSDFDFLPRQAGAEQSKQAALKALALDETLSEAHVSLGTARLGEWSWAAAEKEFQRAIELEPNNATAHQWYGYMLRAPGRFDEAIAEMKQARELDPLTPNKQQSLGATLYLAGRYDEALQQFREIPDPDATSERRHRWMAAIYERKGMQREALNELLIGLRLAGKKDLATSVERKYLSSGYAEAKKALLLGDLRETQGRGKNASSPASAFDIAADYALLGEKDRAFRWLDKSFREQDAFLLYLKVDDRFEVLRPDPRFQDLLHRMGLS